MNVLQQFKFGILRDLAVQRVLQLFDQLLSHSDLLSVLA